jgi:hypothetical protein
VLSEGEREEKSRLILADWDAEDRGSSPTVRKGVVSDKLQEALIKLMRAELF